MTVMARPKWADELLELLEAQQLLYQRLMPLSRQQGELVAGGDAEALLTLLSQRQVLIDQLLGLNRKLEPYRQDWPQLWSELDADTRVKVKARVDSVQRLLDSIIEQDEQDRLKLVEQRNRVSDQLNLVGRGNVVNRAYGKLSESAEKNRYTDKQG
jgi:FlgN protein